MTNKEQDGHKTSRDFSKYMLLELVYDGFKNEIPPNAVNHRLQGMRNDITPT